MIRKEEGGRGGANKLKKKSIIKATLKATLEAPINATLNTLLIYKTKTIAKNEGWLLDYPRKNHNCKKDLQKWQPREG